MNRQAILRGATAGCLAAGVVVFAGSGGFSWASSPEVAEPTEAEIDSAENAAAKVLPVERQPAARYLDMAARIDELLAERWDKDGIEPAPIADDATFLRRACLDLTGVVPSVTKAREFLADTSPDKRAQLVEDLLASPAYATHMASTWRNIMLQGVTDVEQLRSVVGVQNWLRRQFAQNTSYDNLVADLMVATGGNEAGPALFYTANELKPEKLAASTARIFMGLQIQCAECHNHPFDHWRQEDFWGYAAFFARVQRPNASMRVEDTLLIDGGSGEVVLPQTERVIPPRFPTGEEPDSSLGGSRREQLAIWLVSRENPYLAKAAVNWAWAHTFGRGLVEPVDDLGDHNPASHPELFAELTDYFVETGFDIRNLLRTLANTRAYQLESAVVDESRMPPEFFARMLLKTLSPEQLYDSLGMLKLRRGNGSVTGIAGERLLDPERIAFISKMQATTRAAYEYQSGLPQALMLMNGQSMVEITDLERSRLLVSLEAPFFTDEERLDTLYLATLTRYPREQEGADLAAFLGEGESSEARRRNMADILWAIVNSAEYAFNH